MDLAKLSDQELMTSLLAVCADSRKLLAKLLLHLIEVEERRLALKSACPSLYEFCVRRLCMSDGEACRRIAAARLLKRFPRLLARVESGALNLTTLHLLKDVMTESNFEYVVDSAVGKTRRQVEELVACLAPRPDVMASIVEVPAPAPQAADVGRPTAETVTPPSPPALPSRMTPLSADRFEVRFTASRALRDKIENAKDLLRHCHPDGNLEAVMGRAFDALLDKLKKEKLGVSARPQENPKPTTTDNVPRAVVREVYARDGLQCSFVAEDGTRCTATGFLELDHAEAKALGGAATPENLRVYCRAHNRYHAEQDYGRAHVEARIHQRQRGLDPVLAQAKRGLVNMGFRAGESDRALAKVAAAHEMLPPIEDVIREALAALTGTRPAAPA